MKRTNRISLRALAMGLAVLALTLTLSACANSVSGTEADGILRALLTALDNEDYEEAAALYHPDASMTANRMADFCAQSLSAAGIDLTQGATVGRKLNMRSAAYDSNYSGGVYEMTVELRVGETTAELVLCVVRNEEGYGIMSAEWKD